MAIPSATPRCSRASRRSIASIALRAPVLIAHGTRDPRVPIGESEQFVTALQERQKKVTYETFDYAGHGFIRPDDRRRIYRAVAEFFATHLR